jgi:hypothetical protein
MSFAKTVELPAPIRAIKGERKLATLPVRSRYDLATCIAVIQMAPGDRTVGFRPQTQEQDRKTARRLDPRLFGALRRL